MLDLTNSRCCCVEHGWLRLFGGGLSYLEDLGCAASNGATVFARQQLSNFIGHSPIGGYTPFPAWWVAVLWKKLVGTQALETSGGDGPVHAFAFDSKEGNRTVTVLANWDIDEGRKRSVAVAGCRRSAAVFVLTPAGEEIAPKGEPAVERPVRTAESGSMLPAWFRLSVRRLGCVEKMQTFFLLSIC